MATRQLQLQIDPALLARFEALAERLHTTVDELLPRVIDEFVFSMSPDSADPDNERVQLNRELEGAHQAGLRGEFVSPERIDATFEELLADARRRQGLDR